MIWGPGNWPAAHVPASSSGLGRWVLSPVTGVQIPVRVFLEQRFGRCGCQPVVRGTTRPRGRTMACIAGLAEIWGRQRFGPNASCTRCQWQVPRVGGYIAVALAPL